MMDYMTLGEIVEKIKALHSSEKPLLIAIDGFGGSGKSTIAKHLQELLGSAYVIGMDSFIVKEKLGSVSPDKIAFDRQRLSQEVLLPARDGKEVRYRHLEWDTNMLSEPMRVLDVNYLIVEGISATHPDIADYFDYTIWVDVPLNNEANCGIVATKMKINGIFGHRTILPTKRNIIPKSMPMQ